MATYAGSGVDLEVAEEVSAWLGRRVGTGLFGGLTPVPELKSYRSPVLVSSIDGVGTKVGLAVKLGRVDGLGRDIVHHCVNDIAVHGARPLFFLDYLAFHRVDQGLVQNVVGSIQEACEGLGMRLAGGETAEMPSVYAEGALDVAGAVVGAVEADSVVDGRAVEAGDVLVGLPSSGPHTNGYSLIQRVFSDADYARYEPDLGATLGEALLEPHRCYLADVAALLQSGHIHGLAHITGGGIEGNLSRIIPDGLRAVVTLPPAPALFQTVEGRGVAREEMLRVFNMGIGMIAVCDPDVDSGLADGQTVIGRVESANGEARRVRVDGGW